jgi:hypothetical protein
MKKIILLLAILAITKVEQAQNVGIGTTTPAYPLTVVTNGIGISQETTDGLIKIGFYTSAGGAYVQTHTNTNMYLATNNGVPQMTLSTGGNIGIGTTTPNASAMLDISSNNKGLLIPRMTTAQRNAITVDITTDGLTVYDTDIKSFFYYNTTGWIAISTGVAGTNYWTLGSNNISSNNSGNVGIGISGVNISEKLQVDANIKVGNGQWFNSANDRLIKFGDANFVTIGESGQDDRLTLAARNFIFTPSTGPGYLGYIGINNPFPSAPLSFANVVGEKINLWNTDATHNYGIGVQGGLLQVHSNDVASDIVLGYGSSNSFTERARVFGSGGIQTQGPNGAFWFKDRTLITYAGWSWYANNGSANLFKYGLGDALTIDPSGNIGIGITTPGAKLEINGNFKLTDGSQAANRILTSDAAGAATWTDLVQPFSNVERFKLTGFGAVSLGGGNFAADFNTTLYNYSGNIVIDLAANSVTFNRAGLYHLEFDIRCNSTLSNDDFYGYLEINGVSEYTQYLKTHSPSDPTRDLHFTTDRYMPAGTVLRLTMFTGIGSFQENYLAGYLIAE